MQYAKKMVLLPQEVAQQAHSAHQHAIAPTYKGLGGLDEEMQAILRRQDILPDEKVKLYQHALSGYIQLHQ